MSASDSERGATVPAQRHRPIPHPLRGTVLAQRYRRTRRWIGATLLAQRHNARLPRDATTLQFFPHRPAQRTQIVRILPLLGLRIGFDPAGPGRAIFWDQGISLAASHAARLPADAINRRCDDIAKSTVQQKFAKAAGYDLAVDPLTHEGPLVVKSERNGFHDGRVVVGPLLRREPGLVYERRIDATEGDTLITTRVAIIGQHIPICLLYRRHQSNWFGGPALIEPAQPGDLFSDDELAMMRRFARLLEMDYGELDVMHDRGDGRLYIVDANRTPLRNRSIDSRHDVRLYPPMADAFADLL